MRTHDSRAWIRSALLAAGTLSSIFGAKSIMDAVEVYYEKRQELKSLQKKPVAMLFDAREVGFRCAVLALRMHPSKPQFLLRLSLFLQASASSGKHIPEM